MRESLFAYLLIVVFVWETRTGTVSKYDDSTGWQLDAVDVPYYEVLGWPNMGSADKIDARKRHENDNPIYSSESDYIENNAYENRAKKNNECDINNDNQKPNCVKAVNSLTHNNYTSVNIKHAIIDEKLTNTTVAVKPNNNKSVPPVKSRTGTVKPIVTRNQTSTVVSSQSVVNSNKPASTTKAPITQEPGLSPCKCNYGQCLCCTGPVLDLFRQKICMKVIYTPEDFNFDYSLLLNNRLMYQNNISGKNPRPACIGLPRLSNIRLCAKFSNIFFAGRNVHVCLGLQGTWSSYELFSYNFDCMRMGSQGIAVVKPEDGGGILVPGGVDSVIDAGGDDIEDYDENVFRGIFGDYV